MACVGSELFAIILLDCLKVGGVESRIWDTQYGFRSNRGTVEAILLARRVLDQTREREDRRTFMLALDWLKAFDSVSPQKLCDCLRRFGIPDDFVVVMRALYLVRCFYVREGNHESKWCT